MHLLLIRHGQTGSNVTGALDTAAPGADLTDLGRRQAAALPAALPAVLGGATAGPPASVHASRLVRTQQTAAPLAAALSLPVLVEEGLEEITAGGLEMRTDEASRDRYVGCVAAWLRGEPHAVLPGGETVEAFVDRFSTAVRRACAPHGPGATVAVVSHGAAIRVWTGLHGGPEARGAAAQPVANTGGALLEGDPDAGWRLLRWSADPWGGADLRDHVAEDATGASA